MPGARHLDMAARDTNLVRAVVRFCRLLRVWGVRLPAGAAHAALDALREIEITNRQDFRTALRIALIHRPEDFPLYTYLFNTFWQIAPPNPEGQQATEAFPNRPVDARRLGKSAADPDGAPERDGAQGGQFVGSSGVSLADEADVEMGTSRAAATGMGVAERRAGGDAAEVAEIERLTRALTPLLATRRSRRWRRCQTGSKLDLRSMMRQSLRYGGTPVELPRRTHRVTRTRLLVFCDVSRSMDEYAQFFLHFSAAVLRKLWHVEVYLFATELVRVTRLWFEESWNKLKLRVPDCGGGTQIGACLNQFLQSRDASLLNDETIVIILSDGLDAGEPEVLGQALEMLRRRSRAIFWLNPLSHLEGYAPTARGMAMALRYIDVLAPAHDVHSLWEMAAQLRALSASRPRRNRFSVADWRARQEDAERQTASGNRYSQ
ncbi:MAG: VWA domain-containing protein [Candidatus Binatia bacterium]